MMTVGLPVRESGFPYRLPSFVLELKPATRAATKERNAITGVEAKLRNQWQIGPVPFDAEAGSLYRRLKAWFRLLRRAAGNALGRNHRRQRLSDLPRYTLSLSHPR